MNRETEIHHTYLINNYIKEIVHLAKIKTSDFFLTGQKSSIIYSFNVFFRKIRQRKGNYYLDFLDVFDNYST